MRALEVAGEVGRLRLGFDGSNAMPNFQIRKDRFGDHKAQVLIPLLPIR